MAEKNTFYSEERVEFVTYIRKNLKNEKFIKSCLWRTPPSQMVVKIDFNQKNEENQKKVEDFLKEATKTPVFLKLAEIGFSDDFCKKEMSDTMTFYSFAKKVVEEHPHGKLSVFMSLGGWETYARDEAGRTWVARFGEPYKLYKKNDL